MIRRRGLPALTGRTVRRALGAPGLGPGLEGLACLAGRRMPDARVSRALMYHVREGLLARGDNRVRFARIPGGARVALRLNEHLWQFLYFRGCFEPETTRFVLRQLRGGDVVIDVGANVGYYTMMAARAVGPQGRVHAFEPNPDVAALLERSVAVAGVQSAVTVVMAAVGASPGTARLLLPRDTSNTGQASTIAGWIEQSGSLEVPAVSLDEYCCEQGIHCIRLLKVDVEGAEIEVFKGASEVLRRVRPDAIICEFVTGRRVDAQLDVLSLLRDHGYCTFRMSLHGDLVPHPDSLPEWSGVLDPSGNEASSPPTGNLCFLPREVVG